MKVIRIARPPGCVRHSLYITLIERARELVLSSWLPRRLVRSTQDHPDSLFTIWLVAPQQPFIILLNVGAEEDRGRPASSVPSSAYLTATISKIPQLSASTEITPRRHQSFELAVARTRLIHFSRHHSPPAISGQPTDLLPYLAAIRHFIKLLLSFTCRSWCPIHYNNNSSSSSLSNHPSYRYK